MDVSCFLVRFRFIFETPLLTSRSTSCGKYLIDSPTGLEPFGGAFLLGAKPGPLGYASTALSGASTSPITDTLSVGTVSRLPPSMRSSSLFRLLLCPFSNQSIKKGEFSSVWTWFDNPLLQ